MAQIETWLRTDLKHAVRVQPIDGNLFSADNGANRVGVILTNNGQSVNITGGISGYFIRSDEATVIITGAASGNRGWVDLPASAYVKTGPFSLVIKNGNTAIGACTGYVYRSSTDEIIDPGHTIPSIDELLAEISHMRQATADANSAASNANTKASAANTAADNANAKATAANTAASAANTAAGKINNMTVAASGLAAGANPTATISEVSGHKHILFGIPKGDTGSQGPKGDTGPQGPKGDTASTGPHGAKGDKGDTGAQGPKGDTGSRGPQGAKGDKGDPGKDFHLKRTFSSIAAMNAYDPDQDPSEYKVEENDFVMIDTGNVEDADTGKLFCYEPDTQDVWRYIGDLSGKQGIQGPTGNGISSVVLNQDYTLTINYTDGTSTTTTSIRGAQGPKGDTGSTGATGPKGDTGNTGAPGATPDISIGTVTTLLPNQQATVELDESSTPEAPVFNFGIPKGETGSAENIYASTLEMSPQDSTKVSEVIAEKADKDTDAVTGNFAAFDANGNPVDSGHKHSNYLTSHQTIRQDGITGNTAIRLAFCTTSGSTKDKTASIISGTFALGTGARVSVYFVNSNTNSSPTLNINNTGAKSIRHRGSLLSGTDAYVLQGACDFVYDETLNCWHLVGNYKDTKNTAGASNTSSKLFLIGATAQSTSSVTYTHDTVYVGTDGCLYSGGEKVLTQHQDISGKLNVSEKGAANGVAELDVNGKVPASQLPSYVDDVLEYDCKKFIEDEFPNWVPGNTYVVGDKAMRSEGQVPDITIYPCICIEANSDTTFDSSKWRDATFFPSNGESGKIYIDKSTNKTYRWSGTAYAAISSDLALGETASSAYRGDRGAAAYAAAVTNVDSTPTENSTHLITSGGVKAAIPGTMTGATSSVAGTDGLVPAPAAGDQIKVLMGDGTWDIAPGARVVDVTATVTNTSGSYSHTFEDEDVTSDMVPMRIAIGNAKAFRGKISITPGDGEYTISCPNVAGTSTITVYFVKQQQNPTQITSTEFDILNNRLLAVENVYADTDVTIASTDWALSSGSYSYTWESTLVTAGCGIEIILRDGAENAGIDGFDFAKVTGGIQFTTENQPSGNLPITIRIINTKSDGLLTIDADSVASEAITGCETVEEALENLDGRVGNVPSGKTAQGQIDTLNSKITNITITQTNAATGRMLGKNNVRKWGRNVEVVVSCDTISPASNGWINIATLPVGNAYRPYETLDFGIANNADDTMVHGRIEDGVIKVYGKTGVSLAPIVLVHFISAE